MARFVEREDPDYLTGQQIVDRLGVYVAARYQALETYLLAEIARRVKLDMTTDDPIRRLEAIRQLRTAAAEAIAAIDSEQLAREVVERAIREGEAAAIEQLAFTRGVNGTAPLLAAANTELPFAAGITPTAALASAQLGLELSNALADVNARLLRAVPDVYQETIARFAGDRLLGGITGRQAQTRAVADFLSTGISGFVDQGGRRWKIGSYTEMATRTATNRAWLEAHIARFQAAGLSLVTIVRGSDSCAECAAWSGRILNVDAGPTGTITAEHATTGAAVTITVAGSLADARAGGWNHPNCRCTLAPVFPGLSLPADDSTYDPQAEKDRDRLRYLERRVREFKRRQVVAAELGDDVAAAEYRRRVRDEQARIREHILDTGQVRKPYRESVDYLAPRPATPGPRAIES